MTSAATVEPMLPDAQGVCRGVQRTLALLAASQGISVAAAARALGRDRRSFDRMREVPTLALAAELGRELRWSAGCVAEIVAAFAGPGRVRPAAAEADCIAAASCADIDDDRAGLAASARMAHARADAPARLRLALILASRVEIALGEGREALRLAVAHAALPEQAAPAPLEALVVEMRRAIAIDLMCEPSTHDGAGRFLGWMRAPIDDGAGESLRARGNAAVLAAELVANARHGGSRLERAIEALHGEIDRARCRLEASPSDPLEAERSVAWTASIAAIAAARVRAIARPRARLALAGLGVSAQFVLEEACERACTSSGAAVLARRRARVALVERREMQGPRGRETDAVASAMDHDERREIAAYLPCAEGLEAHERAQNPCRMHGASFIRIDADCS